MRTFKIFKSPLSLCVGAVCVFGKVFRFSVDCKSFYSSRVSLFAVRSESLFKVDINESETKLHHIQRGVGRQTFDCGPFRANYCRWQVTAQWGRTADDIVVTLMASDTIFFPGLRLRYSFCGGQLFHSPSTNQTKRATTANPAFDRLKFALQAEKANFWIETWTIFLRPLFKSHRLLEGGKLWKFVQPGTDKKPSKKHCRRRIVALCLSMRSRQFLCPGCFCV